MLICLVILLSSSLCHSAIWRKGNESLEFIDADNNAIRPRYSVEYLLVCLSSEMTPTIMVRDGQFVQRNQLLAVFSHKISPRIHEIQKFNAPASGIVEILGCDCATEDSPIIALRHVPKSENRALVNMVNTAIEYFIYSSL